MIGGANVQVALTPMHDQGFLVCVNGTIDTTINGVHQVPHATSSLLRLNPDGDSVWRRDIVPYTRSDQEVYELVPRVTYELHDGLIQVVSAWGRWAGGL